LATGNIRSSIANCILSIAYSNNHLTHDTQKGVVCNYGNDAKAVDPELG
jgi:hypothetical protein